MSPITDVVIALHPDVKQKLQIAKSFINVLKNSKNDAGQRQVIQEVKKD